MSPFHLCLDPKRIRKSRLQSLRGTLCPGCSLSTQFPSVTWVGMQTGLRSTASTDWKRIFTGLSALGQEGSVCEGSRGGGVQLGCTQDKVFLKKAFVISLGCLTFIVQNDVVWHAVFTFVCWRGKFSLFLTFRSKFELMENVSTRRFYVITTNLEDNYVKNVHL